MVKLFVGNIDSSRITKDDLLRTFSEFGPVTDTVVMQGGFGFVHFEQKDDAERAVTELNGTSLNDSVMSVEMSHGKRGGKTENDDVKIFVGNIDKQKLTNEELEACFARYGTVTEAVVVDKYGFVHMSNQDEARIAIKRLDRTELNGCRLEIALSTGRKKAERGGYRNGDRRDHPYDYPPRGRDYGRGPPPDPYYRDRYAPPPRRPAREPYYEDHYYPPRRDPYYADPRDDYYRRGYDDYPPPRDRYPPPRRGNHRSNPYPSRSPARSSDYPSRSYGVDSYSGEYYDSHPYSGPGSRDEGRYPPPKRPAPSDNYSEDRYQEDDLYGSGSEKRSNYPAGAPPPKRSGYGASYSAY